MKSFDYLYLNACCICVTERGVWFVQGMTPILYFYSFGEKKITVEKVLLIDNVYGMAFFSDILVIDDQVYLIPNNAKRIVVYNILNGDCEYIAIEDPVANMYIGCYLMDGYIYCVPYKAKKMLRMKIDNHKEKEYIDIYSTYELEDACINGSCKLDDLIYCVLWKTNKVVVINLKTAQIQWRELMGKYSFSDICSKNNLLYLYDMKKKSIIIFNENMTEKVEEIYIGWNDARIYIDRRGTLLIDDVASSEIMLIDRNGEKKKLKFEIEEGKVDISKWKINFWGYDKLGNIWGITNGGDLVFIKDFDKQINVKIKITRNEYYKLNKEFMLHMRDYVFHENFGYSLEGFLGNII